MIVRMSSERRNREETHRQGDMCREADYTRRREEISNMKSRI
jgi:hypothetical protein